MELLTDVLAIVGWGLLGAFITVWLELFSDHEYELEMAHKIGVGFTFALIAASVVLRN